MADDRGRFEVRVTSDSHFAWLRTRLSVERTLMSWLRTSVSLIGFGFTIVQFFERLPRMSGVTPPVFPEAPRYLGLSLIGAGVLSMIVSGLQYHWMLGYLRTGDFEPIAGISRSPIQTPIYSVTIVITLIGLFAFGAVLLRAV